VAVIVTFAGEGRSAGAIKIPSAEIVPMVAFPPLMPFTLQVTATLLTPATVALSCSVLPNKTVAVVGFIETVMVGGGGGGEPELAPPPPQPGKIAKAIHNPNSQPLARDRV
jgi:hypothetical protein